jgi:UDP-glucose:(heptosyl)LPS alpha-1,3-glucosyltransferase
VLLQLEANYFRRHRPRLILCTSQREVEDLVRLYGVPRELMHVVPNGYDGSRFSLQRRTEFRAGVRNRLGIDEGGISLLFVANELHRKGFAVLLEAIARVGDRRLRIDLVGSASPAGFRSQIQRLGLTEHVHWHGPTHAVEEFMAAGDVLVLPTQYEPFGLVIIEALASGLPVIATALAGAAPAVTEGVGLLQQDPHDADELAALIHTAIQPGVIARWSELAPAAAAPYEWGGVLTRAEGLIFKDA